MFCKIEKTQLFHLVIKLMSLLLYQGLVRDEKLREVSVSYFFLLRITLMLSSQISISHLCLQGPVYTGLGSPYS